MEIRRGTLKSYDAGAHEATVAVAGSISTWLDGIAVSRGITAAEMVAGRHVAVLFFDPTNPEDAVVSAVWT